MNVTTIQIQNKHLKNTCTDNKYTKKNIKYTFKNNETHNDKQ